MADGARVRGYSYAPTPIVGLVVAGALLLLLEGLLEVVTLGEGVQYGLPAPISLGVLPALTILLAAGLLVATWSYAAVPSWGFGVLFLILGGLSFLLGAGFLVGGVLILIGGALACFADWVQDQVDLGFRSHATAPEPRRAAASSARRRSERQVSPTAPWQANGPASMGGIVVYRPCPSCGELNARELSSCSACGRSLD